MLALLFWNAAGYWPLALATALAAFALVMWLYPGQTRGLPRAWQWLLPLLRITALVALGASLLKPTIVRQRTDDELGGVVILVDRSASMGTSDRELQPAEKMSLADALGILPEGKRVRIAPEAMSTLRTLWRDLDRITRAAADLEYARLSGRKVQDREKELTAAYDQAISRAAELGKFVFGVPMDDSLKQRVAAIGNRPAEKDRAEWVRRVRDALPGLDRLLQQRQSDADIALYKSDVGVRESSEAAAATPRLRLVEQMLLDDKVGLLGKLGPQMPVYGFSFAQTVQPLPLRSGNLPAKRLLVEADGPQTRLAESVAAALEQVKGRPVRAVVMFSDGRVTGDGISAVPATIGSVPVFTVACGRERSVKDLAIFSVEMPASAFVGETVTVKVTLRGMNVPSGPYDLRMIVGKHDDLRQVKLDRGSTASCEFTFKTQQAGVQKVHLEVKGPEGEATLLNNIVERWIKVMQDRVAVLLITSQPTWDYEYFRNAMLRTPWVKLTDVVVAERDAQLSLDARRIAQQDVICLFGVNPSAFNSQQIDAIHKVVADRGGSVLLVPNESEQLEAYTRNVLLSELLPYRAGGKAVWRVWPGDRAVFRIEPSAEALGLDVVRLADDLPESRARWASLPAVYRYVALSQLKPNVVRSLLVDKNSQMPVLTESRLGSGRTFFLGLDETWRWRLRVGERDQDRFWLQLVRYAADEPYAQVNAKLAMDLDRVFISPGDAVNVRVRLEDRADAAAKTPIVKILQNGKTVREDRPVPLGEAQPGRFAAAVRDLPAGRYDVVASMPDDPESKLQLPLEVGWSLDRELADVSADPGTLRQLASSTGGSFLWLEQTGDLARRITNLRRNTTLAEVPLWTSPYLFLLVLGCLAAEWAIRKRAGLA